MSNNLPSAERVCAYLRDSGGGGQELSASQQAEKIGEFCRANDLVLTRQFVDAASGGSTAGRDAFVEMINYLTDGAAEAALVVWSYSRFSRDYTDTQFFLARLRMAGKRMISVTDPVPETLDGRILESLTAWKNAKYREDMSKDIRRGQAHIATVYHAWPHGTTPFGYQRIPVTGLLHRDGTPRQLHRLEPGEYAPLVREAYQMRAGGSELIRVLDTLRPHITTVKATSNLLRNQIYTGRFEHSGVIIPDFCPAIVDHPTWQAAQEVNEERSKLGTYHPRRVNSRFILSGLVRCGMCGGVMVTARVQGKYDYYRCGRWGMYGELCGNGMVRKEKLEAAVMGVLLKCVLTDAVAADVQAQLECYKASQGSGEKLDLARLELSRTRTQIGRLVDAIRDAGHSSAMLAELASLEADERRHIETIARLEIIKPQADVSVTVDVLRKAIETAEEIERGKIVRGFVLQVVVWAGMRGSSLRGHIVYQLPGVDGLEARTVDF